jgi:hypothetical protein
MYEHMTGRSIQISIRVDRKVFRDGVKMLTLSTDTITSFQFTQAMPHKIFQPGT